MQKHEYVIENVISKPHKEKFEKSTLKLLLWECAALLRNQLKITRAKKKFKNAHLFHTIEKLMLIQ